MKRTLIEMFLAACLGMAVVIIPVALDPNSKKYDAAFLPWIRNGVEGAKPISYLLLVIVGAIFGYFGRGHFGFVGMATMALFPIWSCLDMFMGNDHNLFPIEWIFYGIQSLLGMLGAGIGRFIAKRNGPEPWYR
ncbi:MAG: hypothetical protein ACKVS6_04955 [Planctomycetota bacterium]